MVGWMDGCVANKPKNDRIDSWMNKFMDKWMIMVQRLDGYRWIDGFIDDR